MINDVVRDEGKKKERARERIEGGKCESVDMVTRRYERPNPARKKMWEKREAKIMQASEGNFYIEHVVNYVLHSVVV